MRREVLFALAAAGAIAACSGPADLGEEDAPSAAGGRFGLVSVSYDHDWADHHETGHSGAALWLTSTAQFVRYAAIDRDQVARLLALPLEPARDLPEADQCRVYDVSVDVATEEALDAEETGSVELLEAGNLKIATAAQTVTLSPRHFPWLLPFISGVVYGEAQSNEVAAVSEVHVQAEGGASVGAFGVESTSPALPRIEAVNGQPPAAALAVDRGRGLALSWSSAPQAQGGQLTYLELRYSRHKRDLALRCRLVDDGAFLVPAAILTELHGNATLELVRLHRKPFSAAGLEQAEMRVTARDRLTVGL